jgi:multiple antibiotic resistance protein
VLLEDGGVRLTGLGGFAVTVFLGFFAIMNPITNIPIFLGIVGDADAQTKKRTARTAAITAFIIVIAFILLGNYIFSFFGITIPAFKIAGGILVFYVGFEMLQSKKSTIHHSDKLVVDEGMAVSPLAIPILAGPGTIVTAMNYVTKSNVWHVVITCVIFGVMIILTYLAFAYSDYVVRRVGDNIVVVLGKLMGLLLAIIGANMAVEGIRTAFQLGGGS